MAGMISTIILKVDLDCHQCYKKIRKILCKLQDQERIRTISYDGKSNTVAIAGPFDALNLTCKIRCHAGKVVKDVHIINAGGGGGNPPNMADHAPPPQPPPLQSAMSKGKKKKSNKKKHCEEDKHSDPAPPPPAVTESSPPPRPPSPPPAEQHPPPSPPPQMMSVMMPPSTYEEKKPREWPAELEPPPPMDQPPSLSPPVEKERPMPMPMPMRERPSPVAKPFYPVEVSPTVEIPSWPAAMPPPCGCGCYQGYYEGCRCGSCGRVYGYSVEARPLPPLLPSARCYGNGGGGSGPYCGGYSGCRVVNEEDPTAACSVM